MSGLMSQYYQDLIDKTYRVEIVRDLELDDEFLNEMRQDNCMTESMEEHVRIKLRNEGRMAAVSEFLRRLKSRPQKAFDRFRKTLQVTGHEYLLHLIEERLLEDNIEGCRLDTIDSAAEINRMVQTVSSVKSLKDLKLERMTDREKSRKDCYLPAEARKQCGRVLLVNIKNFLGAGDTLQNREGSDMDIENLEKLFKQFNTFDIRMDEDLGAEGIREFLEKESKDLSGIDILIVILMSHGKHNAVYGNDKKLLKIFPDIVSIFSDTNCSAMAGKPKLFFIQACQIEEAPNVDEVFDYPHALLAMATVSGSKAYRAPSCGSWFIRALVVAIAHHSHSTDIDSLLDKIRKVVSSLISTEQNIQLSRTISTLQNRCYLFS